MVRTIAQRLADGLVKQGWTEQDSKTHKYRTFAHPEQRTKLYVGKSGALRKGANSSTSMSITGGIFYKQLLKEEA